MPGYQDIRSVNSPLKREEVTKIPASGFLWKITHADIPFTKLLVWGFKALGVYIILISIVGLIVITVMTLLGVAIGSSIANTSKFNFPTPPKLPTIPHR